MYVLKSDEDLYWQIMNSGERQRVPVICVVCVCFVYGREKITQCIYYNIHERQARLGSK